MTEERERTAMPSIQDVAKRAGVSITTVSRVINNSSHPVNDETRRRVQDAVAELGYEPNLLARALVSEKSRIIGVIVGDASDPYFATIVRGASDAAREQGYLTIICNTDRIPDVELNFVRFLRDYNTDGIIFAGGGLTDQPHVKQLDELVAGLQANQVPVIALGNQLLDVPQVSIDNRQAAADMTAYLIELGHRRIGYISGPPGLTTSQHRLEGYKQALAAAGIPLELNLVTGGDFTYESGCTAADYFLDQVAPPTAIFAANDREAMGCLYQLKQRAIDVPRQMSVAGFDDIEATQYVHPALTTVHVPMHAVGFMGVKQLFIEMEAMGTVEQQHTLPHSLVLRDSTASPAVGTR